MKEVQEQQTSGALFSSVYPTDRRQNSLLPDLDDFGTSAAPSAIQSSTECIVRAKKVSYPKSVFCIFLAECAERFSYYGVRSKSVWSLPGNIVGACQQMGG